MSASPSPPVAERYRLVSPLGSGGMGRVWLGYDEVLRRDVAVKEVVPPPGLSAAEQDVSNERSLREARAIARLNHTNVVRIYDVVNKEPYPWIVMEYVPSRSLHQVIEEEGPLPPIEVARIGLAVLHALCAAHRAGIVHRDVKPSNVLLSQHRVVLTDWGLATMEGDATVTRTGMIIGSPAYISPERARDGTYAPASDLWSLGATLYAAVEGRAPFERSSAIATLTALATEEPEPPQRAGPLRPLLAGLLAKDPAHRMGPLEAERALRRVLGRPKPPQRAQPWRAPRPRGDGRPGPSTPIPGAAVAAARAAVPTSAPAEPAVPPVSPEPGPPVPADLMEPPADLIEPPLDARDAAPPDPRDAAGFRAPLDPRDAAGPRAPLDPRAGAGPRAPLDPRDAAGIDGPFTGTGEHPVLDIPLQARGGPAGRGRAARFVGGGGAPVRDRAGSGEYGAVRGGQSLPGRDRRRTRRMILLLAILLEVLLVIGLGIAFALHGHKPAANPGPARSAAKGTTGAAGAIAVGSTPGAPLPAGWRYYQDQTGFRVAVRDGWTNYRRGTIVYFHDDGNTILFGVDQSNQPKPDPVADWRQQEANRVPAGDFPGYQLIGINPVPYHVKAADWEFLFNRNGVRRHVINRGAVFNDHQAYGFYWETPADEWNADRADFDLITRTFQGRA